MELSLEEMKSITRRFVSEPWGKGDISVLDELCSPDYALGEMGLPEFKNAIREIRKAVPDLTIEIKEMIAEGDKVAYSWDMRGTHNTTKKPVRFTGITIIQFADGKIVRDQYQSSSPSLEEQLS